MSSLFQIKTEFKKISAGCADSQTFKDEVSNNKCKPVGDMARVH